MSHERRSHAGKVDRETGLEEAGFQPVNDGIEAFWSPAICPLKKCFDFGREFAVTVR